MDNLISASFKTADDLSIALLETMAAKDVPVGYGLLACGLTICRLMNPQEKLSEEEEIKFTEELMNWVTAYHGAGKGKVFS